MFENSAGNQSYAGAEIILAGSNSIEINTPALYEFINQPPGPVIKSGIFRLVGGSVETVMTPGLGVDAIPRYTIANPAGAYSCTTGLGIVNTAGAAITNIAGGAFTADAGGAASVKAGLAIGINAGGAVVVTGAAIFLN